MTTRFPSFRPALAGFAVAISSSCVHAAAPPVRFAVPDKQLLALGIEVAPLQAGSGGIAATFPAQVVISPEHEQVVSSPIAGLVVQLLVRQDQAVRVGAPLLRIAGAELGQQQLQLLQAASRARLARLTAKREKALFDEGIVPERRAQEAQAALDESEAALAQSRAALRLSGMSAGAIDRVAATGKPEDGVTLLAPRSGVVTRLEAKPGQRVEPATALLQIAQIDKLSLDIQVPADLAAGWKPGTQIKLHGRDGTARIASVSATVSPGSQTVSVRASVEGGAAGLRAGESLAVAMPTASVREGWEVPLAALAHEGAQAHVFVRTPEGFEARPVKVTASAGQRARVDGALKVGEQIAVSGIVAIKGAWLDAREKEKEKGIK